MPEEIPADPESVTPRWVKAFGIVSAVVIVLFVILLLAGGGQHGPGRHMQPPGEARVKPQP